MIKAPIVNTRVKSLILLHKEEPCSHRRGWWMNQSCHQIACQIFHHCLSFRERDVIKLLGRQGGSRQQINGKIIWQWWGRDCAQSRLNTEVLDHNSHLVPYSGQSPEEALQAKLNQLERQYVDSLHDRTWSSWRLYWLTSHWQDCVHLTREGPKQLGIEARRSPGTETTHDDFQC